MASEAMQQLAQMIRANKFAGADLSVEQRREGMEAMQAGLVADPTVKTQDLTLAGRPARRYRPDGGDGSRVILYLHGGGYVMGSLNTHNELMARLAATCAADVVGLDYRLAPEHPYPAAVEDAVAAYRELVKSYAGADRVIAGDSAGGGLALALLLQIRDLGLAPVSAGVLFSPWTDLTGASETYVSRAELDPMIAAEGIHAMAALYHGATPADDPLVSPLFAELRGLPPLLVQVGDHEVLLDDSRVLAERAQASGVDVTLQIFDGAFHVFQALPQLPEAAEAIQGVRQFIDRVSA